MKIGDQAPVFTAQDQDDRLFDSSGLAGKKWVLYFYPKDLTPSCTIQACNIRDNQHSLNENGITVVGVSADPVRLHKRFAEKHKLPFTLLADIDKKIIGQFGVWGEKKFMGRVFDGIHRKSFLMDEKGVIIGIIEKPKTKNHTAEILEIYRQKEERK